jgi:hypothetical protein
MALVDKNKLKERISANSAWFNIKADSTKNTVVLTLSSNTEEIVIKAKKELIDKTSGKNRYIIEENSGLAFDHAETILVGLERLRNKIEYTDIVFNLMPKTFTLGELQKVYEVILGKTLLIPAFRRIIAEKVEKTDQIQGGGRSQTIVTL